MRYDLIMITTCCNQEYIYKMIDSVLDNNDTISVCLIVVNQTLLKIKEVKSTSSSEVIIIEHNQNENTSVARNIGVDFLLNKKWTSHFVYFPDDDSSFDSSFFKKIAYDISLNVFTNKVTDVYCTGTKNLFRKINLENNTLLTKNNFNIVGAVNIILNFATFKKVLYFDTRFGVNAKYGAGEDGDYFIRAVQLEPFYYDNNIYSFHPSGDSKYKKTAFLKLITRLAKYGTGCIALLCKHKMYYQALLLTFRAVGGVAYYVFKLNFKIAFAYFIAFFVRLFVFLKFIVIPFK